MAKKPVQETPEEIANREMIEGIASNITALARSVRALLGGRLKRQAIVILLAQSSQMPQYKVELVLKALETLDKDWLNK